MEQRRKATNRYQTLREEYERKSAFGKLLARLTGKTGSLDQARTVANSYESGNLQTQGPIVTNDGNIQYQFTNVEDPNMYQSQQGRSR